MAGVGKRSVPERIVTSVVPPATPRLAVADLYLPDGAPDTDKIEYHLSTEGRMQNEAALDLIGKCRAALLKEPNLLECDAPVYIVGDLHGQFYDLLQMFRICGAPNTAKYLFLGDYVDRGIYGTETVLLLLALKLRYPDNILLLRGNHESRAMTEFHNFRAECVYKYSSAVYAEFCDCFDALPIGALVKGPAATFLCMHGGLSPEVKTLDDIRGIFRAVEVPPKGPLCDLLWSDPLEEDTGQKLDAVKLERWFNIEFIKNDQRGCSFIYGPAALKEFCDANGITGIIRAHEVQENGFRQNFYFDKERRFPLVTTVFSAPNYCDKYGNKAAVLSFDGNDCNFISYDPAPHPFGLPDYLDAFRWSLPFVVEKVSQFFYGILKITEEMSDSDSDSDGESASSAGAKGGDDMGSRKSSMDSADRKDSVDNDDSSSGLRKRSTAVMPQQRGGRAKKPTDTLRKRARSNVVNEMFRSRHTSLASMMKRVEKEREKSETVLKKVIGESDGTLQSAAAQSVDDSNLSKFEKARQADSVKELKRPLQRHFTT